MKNAIVINNTNVSIKEYHGQRVLTFKDIDTAHKRPEGTAGRNFRANKKHFIDGEDFFTLELTSDEIRRQFGAGKNAGKTMTAVTESGYLMLVKSFTDDLAWDVQRQLVKHYFRGQTEAPQGKQLRLDERTYEYYDKAWNGESLLTTEDVEHLAGIDRSTVCYYLRKSSFVENTDYYHLKGINLEQFKGQNPKIPKNINHLILITKTGFRKLCTYAGVEFAQPQCFIEQKTEPKRRLIQLPSKGMKSLMGYIQEETKAIDSIAYLLMTKDTKENHEAYRSCMMEHIRRIKALSLDVEHIII